MASPAHLPDQRAGSATAAPRLSETASSHAGELSFAERFSYSLGDAASNLGWNMVSSFLLFFYTDVAKLPPAICGLLLLLCRVLDALVDPVIGMLVDRTNTRFGKTKPWLIFGAIPFAALSVLTFSTPDVSLFWRIVYAYVTFTLLGIVYSIVTIPFGALMPMMTVDPVDKLKLGSYRAIASSVGTIIVTAGTLPLVHLLGAGHPARGFALTNLLFSSLGVVMFGIVVARCRERYTAPPSRVSRHPFSALKDVRHNKPWLVVLAFSFLMLARLGAFVAMTIYFLINVAHRPDMIWKLLTLLSVCAMGAGFIAPVVLRRFGKRWGNILSLSLALVFFLLFPLAPLGGVTFYALYILANVAGMICVTSIFAMVADASQYQERLTGDRLEGFLYAGFSFTTKVGIAVGGAAAAYALALVGYIPGQVTDGARHAISIFFYGVPVGIIALQILTVSFYKPESAPAAIKISR